MSDYVVKFTGKDDLSNTVKNIKKELGEVGSTGKTAMDKIDAKFTKIINSSAPLKRQLRDLQQIMANMKMQGLGNTAEFTKIGIEAGKIKDALGDAADAVKHFSSDTFGLQAVTQGMQTLAASATLAQSAIALFGKENSDLTKVIQKSVAGISLLNSVNSLANSINEDSVFILGLKKTATAIMSKMTIFNTAANAANTASVKANSKALQENINAQKNADDMLKQFMSKVKVQGSIIAVAAAAIYGLVKAEQKMHESTRQMIDDSEEIAEAQKKMASDIASSASQLISKYSLLRAEYNRLKTDHEKTQWIEKNKSELQALGIQVDNVTDAENIFKNNTAAVVRAFMERAKAAAYAAQVQREYEKRIATQDERDSLQAEIRDLESQERILTNDIQTNGYSKSKANRLGNIQAKKTEKQKQLQTKFDEMFASGARINRYTNESINANETADQLLDAAGVKRVVGQSGTTPKVGRSGGGGSGSTTAEEIKYAKGSLADLENSLREIQNLVKNGLIPADKILETNNLIYKIQEDISKKKIELGLEADPNSKAYEEISKQIKKEVGEAMSMDAPATQVERKTSSFDNAMGVSQFFDTSTLDGLEEMMDANDELISGLEESQAKLAQLLMSMSAAGMTGSESFQMILGKLTEVNAAMDTVKTTQSDLGEQVKAQKEANDIEEKRKQTLNEIGDAAQNAGSLISSMAQMSDDKGTQTAAIIAESIANIISGYAQASAQSAKLGPWGWAAFSIAGLAQLASMIAQIHSLSGYASGGIVTGGSTHGDNVLARLNGGEMVLNPRQQSNLFKALDNGTLEFGGSQQLQVNWVLKGQDLYGSLKNFSKTASKTGKNTGIM